MANANSFLIYTTKISPKVYLAEHNGDMKAAVTDLHKFVTTELADKWANIDTRDSNTMRNKITRAHVRAFLRTGVQK